MQAHIDKINEMASVMKKAIEVDEGRLCEDEERIKQLEVKANAHFLLSTLQRVIFFCSSGHILYFGMCFCTNWLKTVTTSLILSPYFLVLSVNTVSISVF